LKDIHRKCLNLERDEGGNLTGNVCKKSYGHVKATDPRRRAHFDPDRERVWGLDVETMTGS
jgi:hypothetical protein